MQSSATKIFVLSILLVIVLLIRITFFSYNQYSNVQDTIRFIQQSHDVRYQTQKLVSLMLDYERCKNTVPPVADSATQQRTNKIKLQIQQVFGQLYNGVKDDSIQLVNLNNLENLIQQRLSIIYNKENDNDRTLQFASNDFIDQLNAVSTQIAQEESIRIKQFQRNNDKTIITVNVIFFALGGCVLFLIVAIVITIEKNVFERKSNMLLYEYATLIDLSHDAIVTTNANLQILQWSKGAETLYGFTKEDVIGKKISSITNPEISEASMADILKKIEETGSWRGEMVQYNKAGEKLYLDVSYSRILNKDGSVKGFSSIRSDITELKTSKKTLQQLNTDLEVEIVKKTREIKEVFERMQKAFLAFDINWVCTYANHPIATYLNLPHEAIIGRKFQDFFDGITDTIFYHTCLKALETQEMQELKEYVPYFDCWFETSIYPSSNGVSIYLSDITDQKKIEQEIINQKRQLRNLSNHIQNLREEERKIIARELHDDLGQTATVLKIDIKSIKNSLSPDNTVIMSKVNATLETVDDLISKIRKISHQLRPPLLDNVGLQAALKSFCQDYERKTSITCTFTQNLPEKRLHQDIEIAIFRICQEALTNVARHANASLVNVSLTQLEDVITLKVKDNGNGFDVNTLGNTLGIIGIKERAANINFNLEIETAKGIGTTIIASGTIKDLA
ncbi:PAS domain S-box protein [Parasediminibacterium paludis]|uniref:histidine kinase n=1 Tax=Parasediminibacterium paludis TaxID=908966 RepID=A0ABV8PVD3_9BACT